MKLPRLAVAFDISHTAGDEVVGSAIVFRNGEPDKSEYRKFRIKGDWGNDDFASMEEVVGRYIRRRMTEGQPLPDLMLIDGGRGQLAAAMRAADTSGATDITFASLAKREEEVYLPGRGQPIRLPRTTLPPRRSFAPFFFASFTWSLSTPSCGLRVIAPMYVDSSIGLPIL